VDSKPNRSEQWALATKKYNDIQSCTIPMREGWGSWGCSAWRREGLGEFHHDKKK